MLRFRYPFIISNDQLYERTKEIPWSQNIKNRRLRWTGHLLRLDDKTPARKAFKEFNRKTTNNIGCGNKLTWKKLVNNNLSQIDKNLSLDNADITSLAEDREFWRKKVVRGITACPLRAFTPS